MVVNRVGREGKLTFWGQSFVADPFGRIIAKASADRRGVMVVECDLTKIEETRQNWPSSATAASMLTTDFRFPLGNEHDYGVMDLVGNVGVVILMVTYLLLQLDKIKSAHLSYSVLNALGASLIVASLVVNFNLSAMLMEVFWVLISFIGIGRHSVSKRSDPEPCTHRSTTLRPLSVFTCLPNGAHAATWLTWPKGSGDVARSRFAR